VSWLAILAWICLVGGVIAGVIYFATGNGSIKLATALFLFATAINRYRFRKVGKAHG
jgi:hypothetical protein